MKDYGRNRKKRKEYIRQSRFLIAGVDVPNPRPNSDFIKKTRQPVHFGLMQKLKGLFSIGDHIYAVSYAGKTLFWVRRNCKS